MHPMDDLRPVPHLQIFPSCTNRTDVLLLIGAIYYQLGSYEQCIAFNDRCILLDPHMAEAHANLANALQQIGNWDMAIIYYKVRPGRQSFRRVSDRHILARNPLHDQW